MQSDLSRSNPHKPILFIDFDQTMTNGDDLTQSLIREMYRVASERGIERKQAESISQKARNNGKYGIFNSVLSLCNDNFEEFNSFCEEIFKGIDYSSIQKDQNLMDIMKEASKKFDLYILTNNHRIHVDKGLKKLFGVGLDEIDFIRSFDILETFQNGQFWPKQTPGAFEMASKRVGANCEECIVIDDLVKNLKLARNAGMRTIFVKNNNLSQILRKLLNESNK